MIDDPAQAFDFGPFRIDIARRRLSRDGRSLTVTAKAFDTLAELVRNAGETLSRDEILSAVWSNTVVEENNLSQQISALRKLLGDTPRNHRYIVTVPGVGYRFVAPVSPANAEREMRKHSRLGRMAREQALGYALAILFILVVSMPVVLNGVYGGGRKTQTVAILSFSSPSGDEAIGAGITNTLRARLGSVEDIALRPAAPDAIDPLIAGRDLGVETVLTGSVQREENRIRVTVEMVDVGGSRVVWGRTFDDEMGGVFEMQDRIASDVAARLGVRLLSKIKNIGAFLS